MASLFEPVGPQGRGVYWRRRLVLFGILLLLILLMSKACSGGGGSTATTGAGSTATTGPISTPLASATTSPKPSRKPTPSPSPTKSAAPVANCKDSEVLVTARPAKPNYAVGDTVTMTYVVTTKGGVRCKRDVGGTADEVRVVAGSNVIWSTDFCSPGGKKDVRTIGPNDAFSVVVSWNGHVTAPNCPTNKLLAPAGTYQVLGRNGAVFGPSAPLTLG